MADTTHVYVRMTRDFPQGAQHRRGGLVLSAGPTPVEAEVTDEQLEALQGDPMVEIVDEAEAAKWAERAAEVQPASGDLAAANTGKQTGDDSGRNYGDNTGGEQSDGPVEVTADMKVKELLAVAEAEKVAELETLSKPGVKKQDIVDAILANRTAANTGE